LDIRDLFGYNWYSRRKFLESITELPWEKVTESCGASFDCIRNIFVHSLQAEHSWVSRLRGKIPEARTPFTKFVDFKALNEYADQVEAQTNEYLKNLKEETLDNVFEFKRRDGKTVRFRIEDILMHVVEEGIHHRGELLCIYWQHGIQPPYTSYMDYKGQV